MKKTGGKNSAWSGMRYILAHALKSVEIEQSQSLDWFRFYWGLSVGNEIAAVCRVERENAGVLHVIVAGREWLPVLRAMEGKIVQDINARVGVKRLNRIVFAEGEVEMTRRPETEFFLKNRRESDASQPNPELKEGNLQMIMDEGLRETLTRLSTKLKLLPLLIVGLFFLSNCAGIETAKILDGPNSEDAFIAREAKGFRLKYGDAHYKDPRSYYHYLRALRAETANDFDEASRQFAEVVKHDPKTEKFYLRLAGLYLRTGQFDKGIKICNEALKEFSANAEMHRYKADMLAATNRNEEALEQYLAVLKLEPDDFTSQLIAGSLYFDLQQYERAREMISNALVTDSDNPLGRFYLGKIFIQSGEFNQAADNLKRAVLLRPGFLEAREYLAWVLEKLDDHKEALNEYLMIMRLTPENAKIREYLAQAYPNGTTPRLQGAPDLKPEDSSIHVKLGTIYYEQALYLKALDEFRLIVGNSFNYRIVIAKIHELLGRFDKAIVEMEALRKNQPRSVDILLQIALLYSMNNQPVEATRLIQEAVQVDPENDQLHHSLALAHISLRQNEKAIQSLRRAIELNNKRDAYYFELGSLQEQAGKLDEAIKNMKKVLELNPEHSNAHNFLGYIYSLKGTNLSEAVDHLEKALAVQPQNGYFLDSLGWIYFKKGEPEKAFEELKKAMAYAPPDPVLYDHLGEVYFALKNYEEAERSWKTSLFLVKRKKFDPGAELPEKIDLEEKIKKAKKHLEKSL